MDVEIIISNYYYSKESNDNYYLCNRHAKFTRK